MTDQGNVSGAVSPESFFTDDQQETTQQPSTPVTEQPSSTVTETPQFDGGRYKIKAAGKEWMPKDEAELLKTLSFGVNYESKARELNRQKAELLALKRELETQKAAPEPVAQPQHDLFENQPDPEIAALKAELAELKKGVSSSLSYAEKQQVAEADAALESGIKALADEGVELSETDRDELYLELQDRIDAVSDKAVDTPEKVARLVRAVYYDLHPDALDSIVERRANTKLDELKKSIGGKIVTEGGSAGVAKSVPKPTSFRDAAEMLEGVWDTLG
jgi:hypothetical protein